MRRSILLFLFFSFIFFNAKSQELTMPILDKKIDGSFSYFQVDDLGNIFALTSSGQLKKYNASLDSMGVFNDIRRYGNLHAISPGNALRTLLYFKQYKNILILDRLMQVVNKIDLRRVQLFQVQAVAQSYDNKIWLFDEQESKLKKISEDGKVLFESADLRMVFSDAIQPSVIFDAGGFIYLYDETRGLYVFDYYGAYKSKITLLGWENIQPVGNKIIGTKDNKMMVYWINTLDIKEVELPLPLQNAKQLCFSSTGCYVLGDTGIKTYHW